MSKQKGIQHFKTQDLRQGLKASPEQIIEYLEQYKNLVGSVDTKRKLISLRVPENLLFLIKEKSKKEGVKYQTKIIEVLKEWALR